MDKPHAFYTAILLSICAVGLSVALLFYAPHSSSLLLAQFWFVISLILGLGCALCLFSLFRSYARYSGKVLNGKLQLGGPGVLMVTIVVLSNSLAKPESDFDILLIVTPVTSPHTAQAPMTPQGQLLLELGADRRSIPLSANGDAHVMNIPMRFQGQSIAVSWQDGYPYQLAQPEVTLSGEVVHLGAKVQTVPLRGSVLFSRGEPIPQARVSLLEQTLRTDATGHFAISLPANLAAQQRTLSVIADGYQYWQGTFVLNGGPLMIQLQPQPTAHP